MYKVKAIFKLSAYETLIIELEFKSWNEIIKYITEVDFPPSIINVEKI